MKRIFAHFGGLLWHALLTCTRVQSGLCWDLLRQCTPSVALLFCQNGSHFLNVTLEGSSQLQRSFIDFSPKQELKTLTTTMLLVGRSTPNLIPAPMDSNLHTSLKVVASAEKVSAQN